MKKKIISIAFCLALFLAAFPVGLMSLASNAPEGEAAYRVTADDVRVSSKNNAADYMWPIDFSEDETGARMTYHLQANGAPANQAGAPYMQNLTPISQLDGSHLCLTLHNEPSSSYGDANFMARKFVIKLANSEYQNAATNDLRFTFCVNNADPYIDVMDVTSENVTTQRFYFSDNLDKFGDAVSTYHIRFRVEEDGGLVLQVNGVDVRLATADLIASTSTDVHEPIYLYIAADTDYTDITLNTFHGGEEPCLDPTADLEGIAARDTMTDYALNNAVNTDPFLIRTDVSGGGVHIRQTWGGAQYPYLYREDMQPLDGLTLRFENYVSESGQPLAIYLADREDQWFYGVLPTLLLDPVNGDLKLIKNINNETFSGGAYDELAVLLSDNDLLKTISGNVFDVSLHLAEDGSRYFVVVTIGDKKAVGSFGTSILDTLSNGPKAASPVYVSFGNIDNDATDFEVTFYGYTHMEFDESAVIRPNPAEDLEGVAARDTMTDYALNNAVNTDPFLIRTDASGGGVHIRQTWGGAQYPYLYREDMQPLDGLTLRFENYVSESGQPLAIYLADREDQWFYGVLPTLLLDPVNGDLKLIKNINNETFSGGAYDELAALLSDNDLLKTISGNVFDVSLHLAEDGSRYIVKVKVGEESVAGSFKASILDGLSNGPKAGSSVYASFGNVDNDATDFEVTFYGFTHTELGDVVVEGGDDEEEESGEFDGVAGTDTVTDWYKQQSNTNTILTDIAGGGVTIDQSAMSAERPYCYAPNLRGLEGLRLTFGNYQNKSDPSVTPEQGSGKIGLFFSYVQNQFFYAACPTFILDTNTGDFILGRNRDNATFVGGYYDVLETIISGSDLLKADSLKNSKFTITFLSEDSDTLTVVIDVGGEKVSGTLQKSSISQDEFGNTPRGGACYLSIGGLNNEGVAYSLDFYGYKTGVRDLVEENVKVTGTVADVEAAISALPAAAEVGTADAAAVLTARAMYTALGSAEKEEVTGSQKLEEVFDAYMQALRASQYAPTSTYLARDPETGYAWEFPSPDGRTLFSYKTARGFRVKLVPQGNSNEQTGEVLRTQALTGAYALDGLSISFANFAYATDGSFYLTFTSGDYDDRSDVSVEAANRQLSLMLAYDSGLYINGAGLNKTWLAGTSSILKPENLEGQEVTVSWNRLPEGDYLLSVTVGDDVAAFTIPRDKIAGMDAFDENRVYVVFESRKTSTNYELEFVGISAKRDAATDAVVQAIQSLALDADWETVQPVWALYEALTPDQKAAVINAPTLTDIYMKARAATVDQDGYDAEGWYIPGRDDVAGNYKENGEFVSTQISSTGGLTLDFNQTVYGICQYSADTYVLDGLRLRLSNFRYATDGSLFVGFHSYEAYKQKIWTFDPTISTYGIYFQIGYNGQLRVTQPGSNKLMVLLEDPLLTNTNLQGKEFTLGFDEQEDGSYLVSFRVDGETLTAVLDAAYMAGMTGLDKDAVWFIIHSGNGYSTTSNLENQRLIRNACSVDLSGIQFEEFSKADRAAIQTVIEIIDGLPAKASYEQEGAIEAAWKAYCALKANQRGAVANAEKVFELRNQLFDLHAADGTLYETTGEVEYVQLPDTVVEVEREVPVENPTQPEQPGEAPPDAAPGEPPSTDEPVSEPTTAPTAPDPVVETVTETKKVYDSIPAWVIVLISAGGAIVLAACAAWAILLGKKKNGGAK